MKWYPSINFLAQSGHLLLGMVAVLIPFVLFHTLITAGYGTGLVLLYMLIKEFSFDVYIEQDTVETGWLDTLWLSIGIAAGWTVVLCGKYLL